jgi:hypothetical protein
MATNWHRLFGLMLTDFFIDSPFVVELEKDLSMKKQLLDVVIVRRGEGPFLGSLPDGFEHLAAHNLITFKSHQEALDDWALKELTGHYVNYRKQIGLAEQPLLPEAEFRLYAVCSRYPQNLESEAGLQPVQAGVNQCRRGTDVIRVIVASQLPHADNNAMLHLFSGLATDVEFGATHYRQHSEQTSTLLEKMIAGYRGEGLTMPYTMEDFKREYLKENLKELTPEEVLEGLSREQIESILKKLKAKGKSPPRKPRRKK